MSKTLETPLLKPGQIGQVCISPTEPGFYHNYQVGEFVLVEKISGNRYSCLNKHGLSQVMPFDGLVPTPFPKIINLTSGDVDTLNKVLALPCGVVKTVFPRTQKARGIFALQQSGLLATQMTLYRAPVESSHPMTPVMARPCPSKPRHGFVDSRIVKTPKDLNKVIEETLAQDPHGEVLCMPFFDVPYSAVVTNDAVVFGKGTDGATAGKRALTIPCHSSLEASLALDKRNVSVLNGQGVLQSVSALRYITHQPFKTRLFVETVGEKLVQLRTGPRLATPEMDTTAWAPREFIPINAVYTVHAKTDFLEYEQKLDELKKAFGDHFVVHFPHGSLLSHLAVQAIAKNVPITTQKKAPVVDETMRFPRKALALPMRVPFRKACVQGIKFGATVRVNPQTLEWAVAVIQGVGPAPKTHASVQLLVAAAVILTRAGTGICLGEYRHFFDKGPGRYGYSPSGPIGQDFEYRYERLTPQPLRSMIYETAFSKDWVDIATVRQFQTYLHAVEYDFMTFPWRGAFGGPAWGRCTQATLSMMQALLPLYRFTMTYPKYSAATGWDVPMTTTLLRPMIQACNRLITISHNSGRCLTKILTDCALDKISNGHTGLTIATSPLTAKALLK